MLRKVGDTIMINDQTNLSERAKNLDAPKKSWLQRLKEGLQKTGKNFTDKMDEVLKGYAKIDEDLFMDIEDLLIGADMGMDTTMNVVDTLREEVRTKGITDPSVIKNILAEILLARLEKYGNEISLVEKTPTIILIVGVNGVGKTTTIGKMAHYFKSKGKSVLMVAADTFRAAAVDQLKEWALRSDVDIIAQAEGSDPASVIFDGIASAKSKNKDVILCDTAGRLHNKKNLMNELNKIYRVIQREYPEAYLQTLLVLDATTGQNALSQAKEFNSFTELNGLVITKLDGSAKGGMVFPLQSEYGIPIKMIGIGEGIDDLKPFEAREFVEAIFSTEKFEK